MSVGSVLERASRATGLPNWVIEIGAGLVLVAGAFALGRLSK